MDRNQRQSRAEERMLGRNAACPGGNVQPRGGFGGGVIQRKRRTYNLAGRSSAYRREKGSRGKYVQRRISNRSMERLKCNGRRQRKRGR